LARMICSPGRTRALQHRGVATPSRRIRRGTAPLHTHVTTDSLAVNRRRSTSAWSEEELVERGLDPFEGAAILVGVATLNLTLNLNLKLSVRQTPTTSSDPTSRTSPT
jgi:hypothetical protein